MAKSKAGSVLLLISGILTLAVALVILLIAFFVLFFGAEVGEVNGEPIFGFAVLIVLFVVSLLIGLLKLYSAGMMKNPKRTVNGGILALVLGIVSFGDWLAIIGGIIGIVQGNEG